MLKISNIFYHWYSVCSIWTVDLAYLLHKFHVSFSFFTVTVGANPNYSIETFYKVISYHIDGFSKSSVVSIFCFPTQHKNTSIDSAVLCVGGDYGSVIAEFISGMHILACSIWFPNYVSRWKDANSLYCLEYIVSQYLGSSKSIFFCVATITIERQVALSKLFSLWGMLEHVKLHVFQVSLEQTCCFGGVKTNVDSYIFGNQCTDINE